MNNDDENIYKYFESQFNEFMKNISRLIEKMGIPEELKNIYKDALVECKGILQEVCKKNIISNDNGIAFRFHSREMQYYNKYAAESELKANKLLDAASVI